MYLLYYILLFVFSLYYKNAPNSSNFKGRVFLLLIDVLLILMIGLRAECIGIDTGQYAYIWNYDIKADNYDYICGPFGDKGSQIFVKPCHRGQ